MGTLAYLAFRDEIWRISCLKSTRFHEIQWISHENPHEIWQILHGFHEIQQISCEILKNVNFKM